MAAAAPTNAYIPHKPTCTDRLKLAGQLTFGVALPLGCALGTVKAVK